MRTLLTLLILSLGATAQDFRVEIENTGTQSERRAVRCSVPAALISSPSYIIELDNGETLPAVIGEAHGSSHALNVTGAHHVELVILGEIHPGSHAGRARPIDLGGRLPPFILDPLIAEEPHAVQPTMVILRDGDRISPILWRRFEQSPAIAGERVFRWFGQTEDSPIFHAWAESRVGSSSPLVDIEGGILYSDPGSPEFKVAASVAVSYDEPVHWWYGPQFGGVQDWHAEEERIFRGTIVYTATEKEVDAPIRLDGVVRARVSAADWDGHMLVHGAVKGDPNWPLPRGIWRNRDQTSAPGDSPAFAQQPGLFALFTPDIGATLFRLTLENDASNRRGTRYMLPSGEPLRLDREPGRERIGTFYNSRIDFRFSADNWGKPKQWEPRRPMSPTDAGHMALGFDVLDYVLSPTYARRLYLESQVEAILGLADGARNRPDRYVGRPLSTLAQLDLVLSADYSARIRSWAGAEMRRVAAMLDDRGLDFEAKVWPGIAEVDYGVYIPQAELGFAPWQVALCVKGVIDWLAVAPEIVPDRLREQAVKLAEAVVLEGFYLTDQGWLPYYAAGYEGGEWLNRDNLAGERGKSTRAQSTRAIRSTCFPAVWLAMTAGTDPDAVRIATDIWNRHPPESWDDQKWQVRGR